VPDVQLTATGKALTVLGLFVRGREELTLTEIARHTGMPLSTTHRIVGELAAWGALERSADGRWIVGLRLWEVGSVCPRGQILKEVALP
jgi:DNA-binding IclR family transcriptional regulator